MQKIIIDTNVIVSSLIQKSYPYRIIFDLFIDDKICLCISPPLMAEYYATDECGADFIITGNTNDFTFPLYKQTKIVTPKDYWENYKPSAKAPPAEGLI